MVQCSPQLYEKSTLNGHICEVIYIGKYDGLVQKESIYYDIEWLPKENPGKSCDINPIDFYWFENELLPSANSCMKSIMTLEGLPDF